MRTFESSKFTFEKADLRFSADLSELGYGPGFVPARIAIKSNVTGKIVSFEGYAEDRDASGEDIMAYRYRSDDPNLPVMEVMLFND